MASVQGPIWLRVLQTVAILAPATIFSLSMCVYCYQGFSKSARCDLKRNIQLGLHSLMMISCCIEAGVYIVHHNALSRNDPDLANALFTLLLWLVLLLGLFEVPASYPHIGAWLFYLVCRVVIAGLNLVTRHSISNGTSTATFCVEMVQLGVVVLLLISTFLPSRLSLPIVSSESANDGERQALLNNQTNNSNEDEDEDNDPILKNIRNRPAMEYVASFKVFLPHIIPRTRTHWLYFGTVMICESVMRIINVLAPLSLGWLVDQIEHKSSKTWTMLLLYIIMTLLQSQIGMPAIEGYFHDQLMSGMEIFIKTASYNHILELDSKFHDNNKKSDSHQALQRGERLISLLDTVLFDLAPSLIDLVIATFVLWRLFGSYFGFLIAFVGIGFWWIRYKSQAKTNDFYRKYVDQWYVNYYQLDQSTANWSTVSQFERQAYEEGRFANNAQTLFELDKSQRRYRLLTRSCGSLLLNLGYCLACVLVIYQIFTGLLDGAGQFVMLMSYWSQVSSPITRLASTAVELTSQMIDAEKLLALFENKPLVHDQPEAVNFEFQTGAIDFKLVKFSYDGKRNVSNELTFSVPATQTVALVGETGCGKSTIFNLLFRFYEAESGLISIDGQDIRSVKMDSFRKYIAWVPQMPPMFNMSILDNARYPDNNITLEEVMDACKAVSLHDKIMTFPKQYHSKTGEMGCKLSGGEVQRLAIVRAMLKKPKILLLDEARSQIDAITEAKVQKALRKLSAGITTMIIAHRLPTVYRADKILVVKDGMVVQEGKHVDMVNKPGPYQELWEHQFSAGGLVEEEEEESRPGSAVKSGDSTVQGSENEGCD